MSIKVKNPNTKFEYESDGSILIYTKIPFLFKKRMLFKNMTNGELKTEDGIELAYEVMQEMIIDWKGVEDEEGTELTFKKDYVKNLPVDVVLEFFDDVVLPDFQDFTTATTKLIERGKAKEKDALPTDEEATVGDELGNSKPM